MKIVRFKGVLSESNTYVLYNEYSRDAIIFDICNIKELTVFIVDNNLNINYVILTHEHCDHIYYLNELRNRYNFKLISSIECSKGIQDNRLNLSYFYNAFLALRKDRKSLKIKPFICEKSDIVFCNDYTFNWNGYKIVMKLTPGHSEGSIIICINNEILFTGDSLLFDREVYTRFVGGNEDKYYSYTLKYLLSINRNMIVYPGHGDAFLLKDKFKYRGY